MWGTGTFSRADLDDFRRQSAPTGGPAGGAAGGAAGRKTDGEAAARTHPTRSLLGREVTCSAHASSGWIHEPWERPTCRECDLTRLCALVDAGEPDLHTQRRDPHPVTVDVGVGSYVPYTMLLDGNHRVAAASLRGDEFLLVSYTGDEERAHALLIAEQEPVSVLHA